MMKRIGDLRWAAPALVTAAYAVAVLWGAVHHEPWRDEVVPLSIARTARSFGELAEPLKYEGHPILWYLVLWIGYGLVGQTWVLKAASIGAAVAAVFLVNRSPLPWWLRCAFTFSFFPIYQYSVVSRGYSLEMLLLFSFCALYPRRRAHPLAVAIVLAMLANTEAFGLIMAAAAGVALAVDAVPAVARRRVVLDPGILGAIAVYVAGLALAAAVAFPASSHPLTGFERLAAGKIAAGVGWAIARPVAHASRFALVPAPSVWVWAYFLYLSRRPAVLAFAATALVGTEVLFNVVYGPSASWHVGNEMLILVATLWIDASESSPPLAVPAALERVRPWLARVLAVGMMAALAAQIRFGVEHYVNEYNYDYSANRRLADFLRGEPSLAGAVVTGEPDTPLWSLPYYADNRIYIPREATYRPWGIFAPPRRFAYDLGAFLEAARRVRAECACPVVVTLGWELDELGVRTLFGGSQFEERFVVTDEARAAFRAATQYVGFLGPTITDESYDVYVLR